MKKTILSFLSCLTVSAVLFVSSCTKEGPAGPAGPAGAAGAAGTNGTNGAAGAAGPSAKLFDFTLTFDSTTTGALPGNYQRYQGITGVDTAKDVVLLYNVYVSPTTGTKYYYAMPFASGGVAYNYVYLRNTASTTGGINLYCIIEDPADGSYNPIFSYTGSATDVEKFRAVVIKATTKNSNVNYNDYNSVASFYHLPKQ